MITLKPNDTQKGSRSSAKRSGAKRLLTGLNPLKPLSCRQSSQEVWAASLSMREGKARLLLTGTLELDAGVDLVHPGDRVLTHPGKHVDLFLPFRLAPSPKISDRLIECDDDQLRLTRFFRRHSYLFPFRVSARLNETPDSLPKE